MFVPSYYFQPVEKKKKIEISTEELKKSEKGYYVNNRGKKREERERSEKL